MSREEHLAMRKERCRKIREKLKQNKKRWQERVTKQSENYYQRSNLMVSCRSRQRCRQPTKVSNQLSINRNRTSTDRKMTDEIKSK